ncbi:hypothetical protein GC425_01815 [Corynebacterium sp. zg254]|uniref:Methyl-accepting transducer domain-containing protein n=1 Tax=Corynebacterium zhongnanshanii TaxID=2768834 RepID=A0ABQ6VFT0_9CORY|nr:hypothetical protein F8377_03810 [Corynebacterium zhongnanshanii]MCR5913606.1 hypothetical protein [Corynebacterium sp. zg254]
MRACRVWCVVCVSVVVSVVVGVQVSWAGEVAAVEGLVVVGRVGDRQQAREFAVSMLGSGFVASRAAAEVVLGGGDEQWDAYVGGGLVEARVQDLREIVVTVAAVGGPAVQAAAKDAVDAGGEQALVDFITSRWDQAQVVDDRAVAWQAAAAREGSSVKQAADAALRVNSAEALGEFAASGLEVARRHDRRREVYALTRSAQPTVASGAAEAIRVGSDTAIETFLRYGQFVAAAQDAETVSVSELVDSAVGEAERARQQADAAAQNADQARRATEAAKAALARARDEAVAADRAQDRGRRAAESAGRLAERSAVAADQAVVAAGQAREALRFTADAVARAAHAASRARVAAQVALSRASAAGVDASVASQARVAAEQARDAASAARRAAEAFVHADAAAGSARSASRAASSAAVNADAAAAAAGEAAAAAGVGGVAAAQAREGAARARAAASRARAAAGEVDGLVGRIGGLVAQARAAAGEAAVHAERSGVAAEDAAVFAGQAGLAAQRAGDNARDAQEAAVKAVEAVELAVEMSAVAREAADQRLAQEAEFLKDQARQARAVQDAQDELEEHQRAEQDRLAADMKQLAALASGSDGAGMDVARVRQLAVSAVEVGTPAVAGSAAVALVSGRDEDVRAFVEDFKQAVVIDAHAQVEFVALNDPDPGVREAADRVSYDSGEALREFVDHQLPQLRKPGLLERAWQLRGSGGDAVTAAADEALRANTPEALEGFVRGGGFERAEFEDQLRQAYELARTGGPEVKAAAEAAVLGDREGLNEFIAVEAARRAAADAQRVSHDEHIQSVLERGFAAAQQASQDAAEAQRSFVMAQGQADQAGRYAAEAARWAGQAQRSAVAAADHARKASESLQFAVHQQQRAHAAADQASRDAREAAGNADQAASFAAQGYESAALAAGAAGQARRSADAAGVDAHRAGLAAQQAYGFAWEKQLSEQEQYRAAAAEGEVQARPTSLLEAIKQQVGPEALDVLLDVVGIKDVLDCFKGDVSGCLWAAVGALPVGKIAKLGKALPVMKKLVGKIGDIKATLATSRFRAVLDDALVPAGCVLQRGAGWVRSTPHGQQEWLAGRPGRAPPWSPVVKKCPIPPGVKKVPGTNRYPINARYAGGKWRNGDVSRMPKGFHEKYGDIYFSERGYPIFDNNLAKPEEYGIPSGKVPDITIKPQGSRYKDVKAADEAIGIDEDFREANDLVWHHHEETGRMQLIPRELHQVVRHTGGWAIWGKQAV